MTELTGKTPDIAQENIEKLKTVFPDVFTEGKVDFDKLQQVLGNYIETSSERYNFTWNGKSQALRLAQTPSMGTLRPCKEESKDWNTTENLYIEGDNLEVLKLLQKSYHGKAKMIYIDPPYNTGGDFVYPDNFKDSIENYKLITGQIDSEGNSISSNSETSGRYHTDWLNLMYPRLRLARNLLTDDGVIFISIDDNEQDNLKKVCNEVFGEDNFIAQFIWKSKLGKVGTTSTISATHEYILCFGKQSEKLSFKMIETQNEGRKENLRQWGQADRREDRPSMYYPIMIDGIEVLPIKDDGSDGRWRVGKEMAMDLLSKSQLQLSQKNGKYDVYRIFEPGVSVIPYDTLLLDEVGTTAQGATALKNLELAKVFDYSKPVKLLHFFSMLCTNENDIILDFFSGSATTAHAVMQLNSEDQGKRKFIMVQLPEPCDEKSEAYKAGYKNICEIGKERIRRAGEKIKEEAGLTAADLDIGFKVFKLDTSNIRKWQPDYNHIEQSLTDYVDNYVDGRSELDVVYEIMLKCGLDLTYPIDEYEFDGKKVYTIGFGALMICLADDITTNIAQEMVKLKNQLLPETWKVVFKDNGFKSDSDKTNSKEILKCGGLDEDAFTTL